MHLSLNILSALLAVGASCALAVPVTNGGLVKRQAVPNLGQIVSDHNKFVANPSKAKVPIPADENNPVREGHRQIHVAIGPAGALIPPLPSMGGAMRGA